MSYCTGKNIKIAQGKDEMVVLSLMLFLFTSRIVGEGFLSNF